MLRATYSTPPFFFRTARWTNPSLAMACNTWVDIWMPELIEVSVAIIPTKPIKNMPKGPNITPKPSASGTDEPVIISHASDPVDPIFRRVTRVTSH